MRLVALDGPRRPEDELLLLLAGGRHLLDRNARLHTLLGAGPDWSVVTRQADLHGVVPLVAHHLNGLDVGAVPPAVLTQIEELASLYRRRSLLLAGQLRQVVQRLTHAGIRVIPLKGTTLAEALYGSCTLRVCTDIDVLVQRAHVARAVEALQSDGYRAEGPWRRWWEAPYHCEITLVPRRGNRLCPLDLHWGLLSGDPRYRGAAEQCWEAARPATVLGLEAWAMSPEWELLFLALHAARSQWQGLKLLVDIQLVCCTWKLDWPRVWAIARQWSWERILELTVEACRSLWELPSAHGVGSVRWPPWLPRFPDPPRQSRWAGLCVMGLLLPSWRRRVGYLLRLVATSSPNDYRWVPLPPALSPLYLLLRPLRWTFMGGRWCLDRIRALGPSSRQNADRARERKPGYRAPWLGGGAR